MKMPLLIAIACCFAFAISSGAVEPLSLGRASIDITPPANMPFQAPQRSSLRVSVGTGTHDPLHAKAIVFESGGVKAAIVTCDLTSIPVQMIAAAREHAGKLSTVLPENI